MEIVIGHRTIKLDHDVKYNVYGEEKSAEEVYEMDFEHLNWLDQRVVAQSIVINEEISILFHPTVTMSLEEEIEGSPYWEKTRFEAQAIFRRLSSKEPSEKSQKQSRAMLKKVDMKDPNVTQKKFRVVNKLVSRGYDRPDAKDYMDATIEKHGTGIMNLKLDEICDYVDIFTGAKEDPETNNYHTREDTRPCVLYYLKFTHLISGDTFKKIGITVRSLEDRFSLDKKDYNIDVIYTVNHPANKSKDIEQAIKDEYVDYKYIPEAGLRKGGKTECFSVDIDDRDVIKLMGTQKVM